MFRFLWWSSQHPNNIETGYSNVLNAVYKTLEYYAIPRNTTVSNTTSEFFGTWVAPSAAISLTSPTFPNQTCPAWNKNVNRTNISSKIVILCRLINNIICANTAFGSCLYHQNNRNSNRVEMLSAGIDKVLKTLHVIWFVLFKWSHVL